MKRNERILKHVKSDGLGIEIGPSYNTLAPKKEGFNVQTIDHISRDELREKYGP